MARLRTFWSLLSLAALCSLVLGALPLAAAPGSPEYQQIIGNVTWSGSSSIDTDVVVTAGATLTIDDTATVYASNYEHGAAYPGGLNPSKIEIIVENGGVLIVEAGAALIANAAGDWYGVVFLPGSMGNITGATIRNGVVGVTILGAGPTIQSNTVRDMRRVSLDLPFGSAGEMAAGIVISGTSAAQVVSNTITNIVGGNGARGQDGSDGLPGGGNGGAGSNGGAGGTAYGIYVANGAQPTVQGNNISGLTGGNGGDGSHGGLGSDATLATSPGGNGGDGGAGGDGGWAVGIYVAHNSAGGLVHGNQVSGVLGGIAGGGGNGGRGGRGGDGDDFSLDGGVGGNGGAAGGGRYGGAADGIYIDGDASADVTENQIAQLTGGPGADGGTGGAAGNGGTGYHPLDASGRDGGRGGDGGVGGDGGASGFGGEVRGITLLFEYVDDARHNTIAVLSGGAAGSGGDGGAGGNGGLGGGGGAQLPGTGGRGGDGGIGGAAGRGGQSGGGGSVTGIINCGVSPSTVARNTVTTLTAGDSGTTGRGGDGGNGGVAGDGGIGEFYGDGGHGGQGGRGGDGGFELGGGPAQGVSLNGWGADSLLENNLVYRVLGGSGSAGGTGGNGGAGGAGGGAGGSATPGSGGDGGAGGDGRDGGSAGVGTSLSLSGDQQVVNNTLVNAGAGLLVGAGGPGGQGGSGGDSYVDPGSQGANGANGVPSSYQVATGVQIWAWAQPALVNNIIARVAVGREAAGPQAAESFGIYANDSFPALILDHNNVYGWSTSYRNVTPGAHDISADPLFVDINASNLHLQAGSPCRNTGTSDLSGVTLPTDDLDGNSRPQGSSHDIGAYEYVETACTPVTGVTISGPTSGLAGITYGFNATVAPANASTPIQYTWTPAPGGGQGTANASYTWSAAGTYNINAAVSNCSGAGTGSDDHSITISAGTVYRVFLPLVEKHP